MSHTEIVRAWKDEEYRSSLGSHRRGLIPDNPAGPDISDDELAQVTGGTGEIISITVCSLSIIIPVCTIGLCPI